MKEDKSTVLIIDDEPECLVWLREYFESKGYRVQHVMNLRAAMDTLREQRFRLVVCDLSIPPTSAYTQKLEEAGPEYVAYPGLFAAHHARNIGHRDRQVVVYSVHDTPAIHAITNLIGVMHIRKGHPRTIKSEIDNILEFDPSEKKRG